MMNKRIRQLANQSGFSTELSEAMTTRHNTASGLEKFAEQIVLECCQMMVDLERKYPANLTVREIKQHFGITVKQHAAAEWPMEL
jgi:hypothetical protein